MDARNWRANRNGPVKTDVKNDYHKGRVAGCFDRSYACRCETAAGTANITKIRAAEIVTSGSAASTAGNFPYSLHTPVSLPFHSIQR